MGKWIGIVGVERVGRLVDFMEHVYGRVGLCAFQVLCKHVISRMEDGELVHPCGLGHGTPCLGAG